MGNLDPFARPDSLGRFLEAQVGLPKHAKSSEKLAYCPFEISERDCRYLEIRFPFPSMAVCLPYAQLTEISGEWRLGRCIILVFARHPHPIVVKIDGSELHDLYAALQHWKASAIAQFDPAEHLAIVGNGAVIKNITLTRSPPPKSP